MVPRCVWSALLLISPLAASTAPLGFEQRGSTFHAQLPGTSVEIRALELNLNTRAGALRITHGRANPRARLSGEGSAGWRNWLVGNDPAAWKTDIPLFEQVRVAGLYRGIDLVYHGNGAEVEYDFIIAPHADPGRIEFRIGGARSVALEGDGALRIGMGNGNWIAQHRPVAYQTINGVRREVKSRFVLMADGRVRFALGRYDSSAPLTIDPIIAYSSFLGGAGTDEGHAVTVDAQGNLYLAGRTFSTKNSNSNVLLLKVPASGVPVQLVLGGTVGNDSANAIAVDASGNVYLAGATSSIDFPVGGSYVYQPSLLGTMNAFILALPPSLNTVLFGTFVGGSYADQALAIALGPNNTLYVAGDTTSPNLTVISSNAFQVSNHGNYDAFLVSFTTQGIFNFGTYIGGSGDEHAYGLAVDTSGATYVVGSTTSADYPASPYPGFPQPFQLRNHGSADGFAIKLLPNMEGAYWSTYLGGSDADAANAVALDSAGNIYIAGTTGSTDFPVFPGAYQTAYQGAGSDGFVLSLQNNGQSANWSTFLGSAGADAINAIALDSSNNIVLTGATDSLAFPVTADAVQPANAGDQDVILATLSNSGNTLLFSTYFGGSGNDVGTGVALDGTGHLFLTGITASSNNDFPITPNPGALQVTFGGGSSDAFFAVFGCPNTAPVVQPGAVANAASGLATAIAPGSIISIYGVNLACTASAASAIPLPNSLGSASVQVNGKPIPLYYVSEGQINAQMPYEAGVGTAILKVIAPGGTSAEVSVPVIAAGPGIFGVSGVALALNQNGTLNSPTNGAKPGSILTIFFTGQGPLSQSVATGAGAPLPPPLVTVASPNSATLGGVNAPVAFMGLAPGLVGLGQANIVVPNLSSNAYPVVLTIGGFSSAALNVNVSQ